MTAPRLLLLDHCAALGGAELYLLDVARAYRLQASVLLFEDGPFADRLRDEGIDVTCLRTPAALRAVRKNGSVGEALRAVPAVARLVGQALRRARHADILFANSQKSLLVGAIASLLTRRPLIWNLHDLLTADHFTPLNRRIAVGCANLAASHVIANSQATLAAFRESGGRTPASVVYNGLDPARFQQVDPAAPLALRADLGVGDAPLVGVFSRLAEWKGQHVLLDALANRPGVHALLVGDALFEGDHAYATRLHRIVAAHGLDDRVHFLGFRDDVPALMKACDVVAHTSTTPEPFGRVIVEGMLAERPVIATRAGGATEILSDGVTGHLVPPGDASALGRALDVLLADPATTMEMGRHAAIEAARRFSLPQQIHGIARVLHRAAPDLSPASIPKT
jgi:glycosyltransferase involved in cell wall biosynthesis